MMLATPELADLDTSRLRFVGSGGAACPQPLMDRFAELGLDYRQGYGLSETTSSATTMGPGDQARKPGSIGRPFFHVEARIVDEEGNVLGPGKPGEIQLRGRNVCAGYWRKPQETAESFDADGWFSTGDIGRADHEDFIWIVDRKKDLIISGGENISSIEVEQAVVSHPRVEEAVVVGLPHERWGETPCAVVTTVDGEELDPAALIEHCRERIAHYKCPTVVITARRVAEDGDREDRQARRPRADRRPRLRLMSMGRERDEPIRINTVRRRCRCLPRPCRTRPAASTPKRSMMSPEQARIVAHSSEPSDSAIAAAVSKTISATR